MIPISVVVPSHNRPELLARLLCSVERQTRGGFETIVVDDGSADPSAYAAVLARFSPRLEVRYLRNSRNRGASYSRNRGVGEARHEWVALVDDDDEWLPEKLEKQAALVESSPGSVGLVYAWADAAQSGGIVGHRYRASFRGQALKSLLDFCFIPSPTVLVRRSALEKAGGFDESLPSCQDWDMWTRVAAAGYAVDLVEEVLAIHHAHAGGSIGASPESLLGFLMFYDKHAARYAREGMRRELSEKYRALASLATRADDHPLAGRALGRSVAIHPLNWKAWIRRFQQAGRGR